MMKNINAGPYMIERMYLLLVKAEGKTTNKTFEEFLTDLRAAEENYEVSKRLDIFGVSAMFMTFKEGETIYSEINYTEQPCSKIHVKRYRVTEEDGERVSSRESLTITNQGEVIEND